MFTGIVEEIGTLRRMKPTASSCTLTISCEKVLEGTKLGDSIAVNGTCLTVTRMDTHSFDCDVTPETLSRTSFSMVRVGSPLNLERALRLSDRLGGHIVLGHVDTTGRLISFIKEAQHGSTPRVRYRQHAALRGVLSRQRDALGALFHDLQRHGACTVQRGFQHSSLVRGLLRGVLGQTVGRSQRRKGIGIGLDQRFQL